jgi:DNA adenine methylase
MRRALVLSEPVSRAALRLVRELAGGGRVEQALDGRHLFRRGRHVRGVSGRTIAQLEALAIVRRGQITDAGRFLLEPGSSEAFAQTAGAASGVGKPLLSPQDDTPQTTPEKGVHVSSLFPWLGGKGRLAKRILESMPPHTTYCELFAGSAAILFARPQPAPVEVINDLDREVIAFFRVLQHHLVEFCNTFKWAINSREMFRWLRDADPDSLTDIHRAARFYYLQRLSFGGKRTGQTYGVSVGRKPRINFVRLEEDLSEYHQRLAGVVVECLPWQECLRRYDRPETLFFVDPPYWQAEGYAAPPLTLEDYQLMAEALAGIQGRAILTINDHPEMRKTFAGFRHEAVDLAQFGSPEARQGQRRRELIYYTWR